MAISDNDTKLLWGRAAGICSNPSCEEDLTAVLTQSSSYNVGEMAHIIAKSERGPRSVDGGGSDSYKNLILLCPTCHRRIDKSPDGTFAVELLHEWKRDHESSIRSKGSGVKFEKVKELKVQISRFLLENEIIWKEFGPESQVAKEDPGSNSYRIWNLRKLDTIIPNNQKIINMIESNVWLLSSVDYSEYLLFKNHATSFEANQHSRLDKYATFPKSFSEVFSG